MTAFARRAFVVAVATAGLLTQWTGTAHAQTLGTFTFQLQPYCNVITMTITQEGATYRLSGWDDACSATLRYPMSGTIATNPNGTLAFAFVVTRPNGIAVDTNFTFTPAPPYSGPWSDSAGNTGTFVLGGAAAGSPRPAPSSSIPANSINSTNIIDNSIDAIDVNSAQVQLRVSGTCPPGQAIRGINQAGTVVCGATTAPTTLSSESGFVVLAVTTTCGDLTGGPLLNFGTVAAGTMTCDAVVHALLNHVTGTNSILHFDIGTTALACGGTQSSVFEMPGVFGSVTGHDVSVPIHRSFSVSPGPLAVSLNAQAVNTFTANVSAYDISCTFTPQ